MNLITKELARKLPKIYATDGKLDLGALKRALPCGTMDALLRLMLEWRCEQVAPGAAAGEVLRELADARDDMADKIDDLQEDLRFAMEEDR